MAVRPAPAVAVSYGHGLSELFASWAEDSPAFAEVPVDPVSMPEGASESDRCLWRRMPALRPATAAGVSR